VKEFFDRMDVLMEMVPDEFYFFIGIVICLAFLVNDLIIKGGE
jgi:hypothetical protein